MGEEEEGTLGVMIDDGILHQAGLKKTKE